MFSRHDFDLFDGHLKHQLSWKECEKKKVEPIRHLQWHLLDMSNASVLFLYYRASEFLYTRSAELIEGSQDRWTCFRHWHIPEARLSRNLKTVLAGSEYPEINHGMNKFQCTCCYHWDITTLLFALLKTCQLDKPDWKFLHKKWHNTKFVIQLLEKIDKLL